MRTGYYWFCGAIFLIIIFVVSGFDKDGEPVPQSLPLPPAGPSCVIDGYAEYFSAYQGERLKFYLNFKYDADVTLKLVDVSDKLVDSVSFYGYMQRKPGTQAYVEGYGYKKTFTYHIPRHLKSGLYHWKDTEIWFLVKEKKNSAPILIVYPSNTEQAYNNSGGKSLYDFNSSEGKRAYQVSFKRPINYRVTLTSDIHGFTLGFLNWLLETDYNYRLIADADLEDLESISQARVVVVIGHSEYWTRSARENLDTFNLRGGNVAIFSGNTMWWQVRYEGKKNSLVCYRDSSLDPIDNVLLKTVEWPTDYLGFSVLKSIGADFDHGGYGSKPDCGWDGYRILQSNSPLLAGTELDYYDVLPMKTHEFDGTLLKPKSETSFDPVPDVHALDAYRLEIIGYDYGHCQNAGCRSVATFIAYQPTPTSGQIVNTASTNWCSSDAYYGIAASSIRTITKNILDCLLSDSDIFSEPEVKVENSN